MVRLVIDTFWLGSIAVGRAINDDTVVVLGASGGIVNGLLRHVTAYDSNEMMTGLGKGLLSVAIRGGLAGIACAAGSGCDQLENPALVRLSLGIAAGAAIDAAFLAYRPRKHSLAREQTRAFSFEPSLSPQCVGASFSGRF